MLRHGNAPNLSSTSYPLGPIRDANTHKLCHDKNINLKKYSTNFYPNLDQAFLL